MTTTERRYRKMAARTDRVGGVVRRARVTWSGPPRPVTRRARKKLAQHVRAIRKLEMSLEPWAEALGLYEGASIEALNLAADRGRRTTR